MNEQNKALNSQKNASDELNSKYGVDGSKFKNAPYTWEISRVHKGRVSRPNERFVTLTINVNAFKGQVKSYSSTRAISLDLIKEREYFNQICKVGFDQMCKQLKEKGIEAPA